MDGHDLPLLELFTRLRDAGLPIGLSEYNLVLRSLQAGFGMSDRAALKRVCQTLWVKSAQEKQLFEYHYEQLMGGETSTLTRELSERSKIVLIVICLIQGILAVGMIVGVTSSSKEQTQKNPSITPTAILPNPSMTPTIIGTQTATFIPTPTQTPQQTSNTNQPNLFWVLLSVIVLGSGFVIVMWVETRFLGRNRVSVAPDVPETQNVVPPELTQAIEDEVQVAQAVLQATSIKKDILESRFILTSEYFPVTERQMKQIWRYLRRPIRQGSPTELDVEATVNQIGRQGLLLNPVLVPPRVNKAELLLAIDRDGSMVPFSGLSRRLVETASRGGLLGKAGIYYFHNCPIEYLYHDSHLLKAELVSHVVTNVCDRAAVLIFSDAGAARGGYNQERCELTQEFLAQIKQRVRYVAWLNPIPRSRWAGTTAGEIARLVSMFEVSRRGLQDAIGVLCGRPTNFEGRRL